MYEYYVHHNPVEHGYIDNWQDWLWSSAVEFLERVGRERALQIWRDSRFLITERSGMCIEEQPEG